ncbi:hypothetical protein [Streptosporangium brasiliense]|uniref:Uncharacterized protein n=1 Tax=Streptosporangium brasiliense TaxID=47480 RepID=A0ABT9QXM5_9ACTN|nr:hypothetical protein [Streptosporangium brasiliense]MDP9861729.1 hypothetical protein [Streptosporangium brasiliense]
MPTSVQLAPSQWVIAPRLCQMSQTLCWPTAQTLVAEAPATSDSDPSLLSRALVGACHASTAGGLTGSAWAAGRREDSRSRPPTHSASARRGRRRVMFKW